MKITIIIPVLNEASTILKIYNYLLHNQSGYVEDILFIDGGSSDETLKIIKDNKLHYFQSEKGRAKQMNFGAQNAKSAILYFLHVDSFPPKNYDQWIVNEIESGYKSGCFKMKFDTKHWLLDFCGWLTKFNFKICRGGDQSLFITKKLFNELEGFDEQSSIYEDNELIHRIYQKTSFKVIQNTLTTSSRRYLKNGIYALTFHFGVIHLLYALGFSKKRLVNYYQKNIK
jgi:rSAM/selenodomain-associated transferase 2